VVVVVTRSGARAAAVLFPFCSRVFVSEGERVSFVVFDCDELWDNLANFRLLFGFLNKSKIKTSL